MSLYRAVAKQSRYEGLLQLMTDRCTVTVREPVSDAETGLMGYAEKVLAADLPCRIFLFLCPGRRGREAPRRSGQPVKLFLQPEVEIPPGSRIAVTRGEKTVLYARSGEPARYPGHRRESNLELWERWA